MIATVKQVEFKERPIIFSGPMVKAILEGRKTQTRRALHPQPSESWMNGTGVFGKPADWSQYYKTVRGQIRKNLWIMHPTENREISCPYGKPGDRLWARETWTRYAFRKQPERIVYAADGELHGVKWTSPLFLPRNLSRITLEIANVRAQRLQDISASEAKAEGVEAFLNRDAAAWRAGFQIGWDAINAKRGYSWASNPFVWVIEFRKL